MHPCDHFGILVGVDFLSKSSLLTPFTRLPDLVFRILHDGPHAASGGEQVGSRLVHSRQQRLAFLFNKRDAGQIDDQSPAGSGLLRIPPASFEFSDPGTCQATLESDSRRIVRPWVVIFSMVRILLLHATLSWLRPWRPPPTARHPRRGLPGRPARRPADALRRSANKTPARRTA